MVLGVEESVSRSLHYLSGNVTTFGNDLCGPSATMRLKILAFSKISLKNEKKSELKMTGTDSYGTQRLTPIGIVDLNFHLEPSSELSKLKFVQYFGLCTVAKRAQSTSTSENTCK